LPCYFKFTIVKMQRFVEISLQKWATKKLHKPLLIRGARQVGKSWSIRNLGKTHFKGNYIELNLEKNPNLHPIFKQNFDVSRIIQELELVLGSNIVVGKTLVFIDEIQECPEAILALRYFYEDMPNLHIIAAGSLLEFVLTDISFPVGRVEQLAMYPMTFIEFLWAINKAKLATVLQQKPTTQSDVILQEIKLALQKYFIVGGMPECVNVFTATNSFLEVQKIQEDLLFTYQQDFNKYKPNVNTDCINDVLQNCVQKVGQQIVYTKLSDRFTMPTIKKAFESLTQARLLHKVKNVSVAGLPLTATGKQFKAIFLDIGLLVKYSGINTAKELENETLLGMFKGALAEQFVGQEIIAAKNELMYWARTEKNSAAEVDYVIEQDGNIIPIEVKAAAKGALRSLHLLLDTYPKIKKAYIFSEAPLGTMDKFQFIPIGYVSKMLQD
jgi:uncharacterized protein